MIEDQNEVEAFKERSRAREEQSGDSGSDSEYEAKMLEAFVAKPDKPEKGLWYANAFAKYDVNGVDAMRWNWSWWAFFGGIWFLIYRKAYAAAGGLFLIAIASSFIPFGGLVISILAGGYSPYFIYKTYKTKKLQIEAAEGDENRRIEMMQALGGYNQWVVILAVIINVLVVVGVIMAIAAGMNADTANYQGY
jgi:hypothetical protein